MELFRYEILYTDAGSDAAKEIRTLIANDGMLAAGSEPWRASDLPSITALFGVIVVVTDDIGEDTEIRARVRAANAAGFPILPVVPDITTYDFNNAPIHQLSARNALGLNQPEALVQTLLHHGGLRRYGSGGLIFISYARKDGTTLADTLETVLRPAGFHCFIDRGQIAGGAKIQTNIRREIGRTDIVVLIDSREAQCSPWVGIEMDFARAAHVPVIAVTPSKDTLHHAFPTPHVQWQEGDDAAAIAEKVGSMVRRYLAEQDIFRERVARVLERVTTLRGWPLGDDYPPWFLGGELEIEALEREPKAEQVLEFAKRISKYRGMLVGGTRPYAPSTREVFELAGRGKVCVTPLSAVASKIPVRLSSDGLSGQRVFLSAAAPDPDDAEAAARTLAPFVVLLVQTLTDLGATIVFGGHPSVTPTVHQALVDLPGNGRIELHQAQYWHDSAKLPAVVDDRRIFNEVQWHGEGKDPTADLAALRSMMISPGLSGAVFIGGKDSTSHTDPPGIVDEYRRFRSACPGKPAFAVGMAYGAARSRLPNEEHPPRETMDPRLDKELRKTSDPDLAVALIVSELLDPGA